MKTNDPTQKYKQTPIGEVPVDWETTTLGFVLSKIVGGGTPSRDNSVYWNGNIPWATVKDLTKKVSNSTVEYISNKGLINSASNLIPAGTIIISTRMAVGTCKQYTVDVAINQDLKAFFIKNNIKSDYLFHFLLRSKKKLSRMGSGSTVNGIRLEDLRLFKIPLPPLPEQKKIAEILSTWDNAIETVSKLIDAKKKLKKGLMQGLLTGKTRFKEFGKSAKDGELPEGWEEKRISHLFSFIKSFSFTRNDLTADNIQNPVYCVHYGDIQKNPDKKFLNFKENIFVSKLKNLHVFSKDTFLADGDIIIADASEDYTGVGESIELVNIGNRKVIGGLHTIVARSKTNLIQKQFSIYLLNATNNRNYLRRVATGSSVYGISKNNVSKMILQIPSTKEQTRIASVLTTADKEIEILNKKLEALKQQKKGLMQVLLTGKVRVKLREMKDG